MARLLGLAQSRVWFLPAVIVLGLLSAVFEGVSLALLIPLMQMIGAGSAARSGAGGPIGWLGNAVARCPSTGGSWRSLARCSSASFSRPS